MGNPKTAASKVDASRPKRQKTGGRVSGTPNKVTKELKDTILAALDGVGGVQYLQDVAKSHPPAFMALVGKVLPLQVSGEGGGPLVVEIIRFGTDSATA